MPDLRGMGLAVPVVLSGPHHFSSPSQDSDQQTPLHYGKAELEGLITDICSPCA